MLSTGESVSEKILARASEARLSPDGFDMEGIGHVPRNIIDRIIEDERQAMLEGIFGKNFRDIVVHLAVMERRRPPTEAVIGEMRINTAADGVLAHMTSDVPGRAPKDIDPIVLDYLTRARLALIPTFGGGQEIFARHVIEFSEYHRLAGAIRARMAEVLPPMETTTA